MGAECWGGLTGPAYSWKNGLRKPDWDGRLVEKGVLELGDDRLGVRCRHIRAGSQGLRVSVVR